MIWPLTTWKRLGDDLDAATAEADRLRARCEALEAAAADLHRDKMALAAQLAQACQGRDEAKGRLARIEESGNKSRNGTALRLAKIARGEA